MLVSVSGWVAVSPWQFTSTSSRPKVFCTAAKACTTAKNFTFLGFREDVAQVLRDLDIFVLSSTSEGFPLVILEAMAAGKPVVATRCGGPQEIVDNGRTGILVEVADPEALAAAISDLIRQPELARRLVASARSAVETRFSIDVMIRQYENFYENLCETSTVPSSLQERRAGSATNI